MLFPIQIFLNIAVAISFIGFWTIVFTILYHLTRFGIGTQPKKLAAVFFVGSITLFCACLLLYADLDLNRLIP
ncbi:MAG: hypothetical protein EXS69_00325 [Candidatus Zambryskibacteria bacterium]|nr:hypothetical protein [Candidatus Zambryskibacteria bacterium]